MVTPQHFPIPHNNLLSFNSFNITSESGIPSRIFVVDHSKQRNILYRMFNRDYTTPYFP